MQSCKNRKLIVEPKQYQPVCSWIESFTLVTRGLSADIRLPFRDEESDGKVGTRRSVLDPVSPCENEPEFEIMYISLDFHS